MTYSYFTLPDIDTLSSFLLDFKECEEADFEIDVYNYRKSKEPWIFFPVYFVFSIFYHF